VSEHAQNHIDPNAGDLEHCQTGSLGLNVGGFAGKMEMLENLAAQAEE